VGVLGSVAAAPQLPIGTGMGRRSGGRRESLEAAVLTTSLGDELGGPNRRACAVLLVGSDSQWTASAGLRAGCR